MEPAQRAEVEPRALTLTHLLEPAAVDFATLHARYGTLLELVRKLIGVIPNCDPILEIWPTAFRSYNVMVPNLLNLPFFLWGLGAPKATVALGMYASSRAAECMYCSAHTCSFALRRGADATRIATRATPEHTEAERAAISVGEALGSLPARVAAAHRDALRGALSQADAEWVVLGIAMMGFLNKVMDALGIDLEQETVREVTGLLGGSGWSAGRHRVVPANAASPPTRGDGLALKLGLVRFLPSALAFDRRWTKGVPSRWPAVGDFLRAHTGHDFPVLQHLTHARAIRAIATMVRDNAAGLDSQLGPEVKPRAGLVFATVAQNDLLATEMRRLAAHAGAPDLDGAQALGAEELDLDDAATVDRVARAHGPALLLAKAASYSPARVTPLVVAAVRAMSPAAVVELVTWLSVLQLLHRLERYYLA